MGNDPVQAFTVTGNDFSTGDGISPTIRAGADRQNTTPMVVVPVQDGRGMEKSQNGLGVGEPGDPMYTLDTTGAQSVAYEVTLPCNIDGAQVAPTLRGFGHGWQGQHNTTNAVAQSMNPDVAGTLDANYGKGTGERNGVERDVVVQSTTRAWPLNERGREGGANLEMGDEGVYNTLAAGDGSSSRRQLVLVEEVPVWEYDGYNQKLDDSGVHRTLRIGRDSSDFVAYAEPTLFEPMSLREENWAGRDVKNALRAEASKSSHVVVDRPEPFAMLNFQGSKSQNVVNDGDVSFTLNAMHGHDVHVVGYERQPPTEETMDSQTNLVVRRLTPLECELLMGWDAGWTEVGVEEDGTVVKMADTHRYRMCGNGVVANVGEWLAARYLAAKTATEGDEA
jgi:hypothetical protein